MVYNKHIVDGKVAVLVSPGYGAGWSTWCHGEDAQALAMDEELVLLVLAGDEEKLLAVTEAKYPGNYLGGSEDLYVEWVPEGLPFEITEYDGSESLTIIDYRNYWVA